MDEEEEGKGYPGYVGHVCGGQEYAEIILPCRVRTASYQNSHVAPICLINYFTMALTAENYDEAAELLRDTEELLGPGFYIGN